MFWLTILPRQSWHLFLSRRYMVSRTLQVLCTRRKRVIPTASTIFPNYTYISISCLLSLFQLHIECNCKGSFFSTSYSQPRRRFISDSETHWPFPFLAARTLLVYIQRRKCLCSFYPAPEMLLFFLSSSRGSSFWSIQFGRYLYSFCTNPVAVLPTGFLSNDWTTPIRSIQRERYQHTFFLSSCRHPAN